MKKECEHNWLKIFVGTRGEYECIGRMCGKCGTFEDHREDKKLFGIIG